ncbi:Disease resistance rpp13-like protein [Thalictrum thalictroides]|uniref:Disease resistance rpp13-like protein n=1 Tax=Thalictrum thalictroides TaxID=46969 RepID=A0A7J6VF71_THATH|nr:Disease resistance rpp13-like protein [Thalictrum thalictroides]
MAAAASKFTKKPSNDPRQMIAEAREEIKSTYQCMLLSVMEQLEKLTQEADGISPGKDIEERIKTILENATGDSLDKKLKNIPIEAESTKDWQDLDPKLEKILEDTATAYKLADYEQLDESHKNCLLCLAIFPQDAIIQKRTVIYWWIGEGFVKETVDKTAEDVGEENFQKLLKDNWINAVNNKSSSNVREFKMDPWVRWLVIHRAREDNFFNLDDTGMPNSSPSKCLRHCLLNKSPPNLEQKESSHGGTNPSDKLEERNPSSTTRPSPKESNPSNQEGSTRSSRGGRNPSNKEVVFNVNAERLRAQDLFPTFKEMKSLVVMHLGRWQTSTEAAKRHIEFEDEETELLESLHKLSLPKLLRYLSFAGISRITELPTSVQKLSHLKILDLRSCQNLETLGEEMIFPKSLTHLDVSECYMLDHMPKGLGTLSQLEVLKGFIFGSLRSKDPCQLAELTKLKKLRKLSISIGDEAQIQPNDMTYLKDINGLRSLAITWALILPKDDEKTPKENWTADLLSYPPSLEKLDLRCVPDKTVWLKPSLKSLKKLYIRGGQVMVIDIKDESCREMDVEMIRLKFLKHLFQKWSEVKNYFPHLKYLEIHECPQLEDIPKLDKDNVWMEEPTQKIVPDTTVTSAPPSTDAITTTDDVSANPPANPSTSECPVVPPSASNVPTSKDASVGSQTSKADGATTTSGPPIETPTSISLPASTSKTQKSSSLGTTEVVDGLPDIPDRAPILTDNSSPTTNITSSSPAPAAPSGIAHSPSTTPTSSSLPTSAAVDPSVILDNPSSISTDTSTPTSAIPNEDTTLTTNPGTSSSQTPPHPTSPTTDAAHDTPTPTDPSNSLSSLDKGHVVSNSTSITPTSSPVAQNNASISTTMSSRDRDTSAAGTDTVVTNPTSTSKTPKSSSLSTEVVGPLDTPNRAPISTDNSSPTTNITSSSPAPAGLAHSTSTTPTSSSLATSAAVIPSAITDNPSCNSTNTSTPAPAIQSEDTTLTTPDISSSQTPLHPTSPTTDVAHDIPTPTDPSNSFSSLDKGHAVDDGTSISPTSSSSSVAQNNASISATVKDSSPASLSATATGTAASPA